MSPYILLLALLTPSGESFAWVTGFNTEEACRVAKAAITAAPHPDLKGAWCVPMKEE